MVDYGPTPTVATETFQAEYIDEGDTIDFTNGGTAVKAGQIVMFGVQPMFAPHATPASVKGTLKTRGRLRVKKDTSTIVVGDAIYWHTDGSPVVGDASSGAANNVPYLGYLMGQATKAAATGVATVEVKLLENVNILRGAYPAAVYGDVLSLGTPQALYELSSAQNYAFDTLAIDQGGDRYRYGYMSGQHHPGFGSYNVGKCNISHAAPAQTSAGLGAIGSLLVRVTVDSNDGFAANGAVAANELVNGRIILNNGSHAELLVMNRRIVANTVVAGGGGVMVVTLDMPLTAAVTASTSYIEVIPPRFAHMIGGATASTDGKQSFLGLPVAAGLNKYGWFKTAGPTWMCPSNGATAPGATANDREVYFVADGSVRGGASGTLIESGFQHAGYVIENSTDGEGPPLVMLQLE